MERNGDWMALALDVLENARREVRLSLPPGQAKVFWPRFLERVNLLPPTNALTIHVLLPSDPLADPGLLLALDALAELNRGRHAVVTAATPTPFPWFVLIADSDRALAAVGDAYAGDDIFLVQPLHDSERIQDLRESFDRRFHGGERDPDFAAWADWVRHFPTRREARVATKQLARGQARVADLARRVLKHVPKRRYWLIKPSPGAWGMAEGDGLPFEEWLANTALHMGWPALADLFGPDTEPDPERLIRALAEHYPDVEDVVRVRAIARHMQRTMEPTDGVIAIDGWTSSQTSPVHVHAWGKVAGRMQRTKARWPWARPVRWRPASVEVPVERVRECLGLRAATYPLHQVSPEAFLALVEAVEARRENAAAPQLSLTLDLFPPSQDQSLLL